MSLKIIDSHALAGLPREVRSLIRRGVYSLYTFSATDGAAYLLATNRNEFYLLSSIGTPLSSGDVASLDDPRIGEAVSFSDTEPAPEMNFHLA
ncbi:MAG: hypothetical protein EOO73_26380 [Myxococcales bacterium]|nr:MAG: hypothetical protein EOO73_26380 [Myxococcales bacterium]